MVGDRSHWHSPGLFGQLDGFAYGCPVQVPTPVNVDLEGVPYPPDSQEDLLMNILSQVGVAQYAQSHVQDLPAVFLHQSFKSQIAQSLVLCSFWMFLLYHTV
jgi:hypothetical protein